MVGAGNVGATAAHWIAAKELADVVLVDIVEGTPQGKSLDLAQAAPIDGFDVKLVGANSYEETKDSDIVIITAGLPRKPGMSRDDLLKTNSDIVGKVTDEVAKYSPELFYHRRFKPARRDDAGCFQRSGFPKNRVMGMAGVLDSARMRCFFAEAFDVSVENVTAFVLGGHGDTMVPLPRYSTCAGIPDHRTFAERPARRDYLTHRKRRRGNRRASENRLGFLCSQLGRGRNGDVDFERQKTILPCAVYLEGEYGINNLFVGVPVKLGKNGVEQIIEISLTNEERSALQKSAGAVQELIDILGI